jgi:chloramphenicol 3-O-phosphotransferase
VVVRPGSLGWIVVLNGAPRSGKSSIVTVIQETFDGPRGDVADGGMVVRISCRHKCRLVRSGVVALD